MYEHVNNSDDGFARPVYRYLYTLWARLDPARDQQRVAQQPAVHTEYREQARATFSYRAQIPHDGLLKINDEIYFIRGVNPRRQLWRTEVTCERVDVEIFATFQIYEGDSTTDGIHLVSPSAG